MTAPRADLDELGRLLAAAHEEGYWAGYGEGKDEAETRDLNYDTLTDQNAALLAEVADLRETVARVEAARTAWLEVHGDEADDIESLGLYGVAYREAAADLSAALDGAQ